MTIEPRVHRAGRTQYSRRGNVCLLAALLWSVGVVPAWAVGQWYSRSFVSPEVYDIGSQFIRERRGVAISKDVAINDLPNNVEHHFSSRKGSSSGFCQSLSAHRAQQMGNSGAEHAAAWPRSVFDVIGVWDHQSKRSNVQPRLRNHLKRWCWSRVGEPYGSDECGSRGELVQRALAYSHPSSSLQFAGGDSVGQYDIVVSPHGRFSFVGRGGGAPGFLQTVGGVSKGLIGLIGLCSELFSSNHYQPHREYRASEREPDHPPIGRRAVAISVITLLGVLAYALGLNRCGILLFGAAIALCLSIGIRATWGWLL